VKNEALRRVKVERNILHELKTGRLAGMVISCIRTAFLNTFLRERWRKMRGRRRRRCKQLLDDIQEKKRYWNFKEEALYRTLGRGGGGRNSLWKRFCACLNAG
jgi:hypothetical protein